MRAYTFADEKLLRMATWLSAMCRWVPRLPTRSAVTLPARHLFFLAPLLAGSVLAADAPVEPHAAQAMPDAANTGEAAKTAGPHCRR